MPKHPIPGYARLNRTHKLSAAGVATAGAAALVFALVPGSAGASGDQAAAPAAKKVAVSSVDTAAKAQQEAIARAADESAKKARGEADAQKKKAEDEARAKAEADAKAKAEQERKDKEAASRSAERAAAPEPAPVAKTYSNDLDGWIREALDIMAKHGIPGSYDGLYRNIMRESTGNPQAVNNYDSNAVQGTPSKGLLQVIDPTFQAYHVEGTSWDIFDPVANIVAACNYAAATYGSMDNVNSAY
ncbi:transglycosylase SLT domain-containing protein [Streptomyces sp. MST-110588]|uniref:transglycosylase SLT domain-containing protein n=1 Tax=Streptomyces sp. MST-110588 TaxID=2833628 RepID=UPI001F5D99EE|nr:transglycosylase SLT domain-containing protein [Streptomyces sp. MST-110588]UNO42817.1 transglycosylase SLT domain-containing protein [Streptomyces sp. MST-110588]